MRKRLLPVVSAVCAVSLAVAAGGCNGETAETAPTEGETTPAETTAPAIDPTANGGDISSEYEWGNVEIVGGGYTVGLYYNKAEDGLLYARTDIGGAYRMDKETGRWTTPTTE